MRGCVQRRGLAMTPKIEVWRRAERAEARVKELRTAALAVLEQFGPNTVGYIDDGQRSALDALRKAVGSTPPSSGDQ